MHNAPHPLWKTVFIFGGSSGIGLESAKCFAGLGCNVVIFSRDKKKLSAACKDIQSHCTSKEQNVAFFPLDVADSKMVLKTIAIAVKQYGAPDLYMNSAGRAYPNYFEKITYEQFDETMKINCYGIWNTAAALVPYMKKNGGTIVNVSSIAGFLGVFGYADYAASKFAVIGLSDVMRQELARFNIKVCVLCPPDTETPGFTAENKTKPRETKAISAHTKVMSAAQVAQALIRSLEKNQKLIIPGFDGKLTYFMKRFFPGLLEFIIMKSMK